jgi:hypothetical protein
MSIISNEMRFLGVNSSLVNLIEKKDSTNNEKTEYYSLDDIRGYKVYTALLTQSGADDFSDLNTGSLTIGVTYHIVNTSPGMDFTNVGAPNNEVDTSFVATGTTPNSWGTDEGIGYILEFNTGAPVVTVLENTIGNIWWTYGSVGYYVANSIDLFTLNKTSVFLEPPSNLNSTGFFEMNIKTLNSVELTYANIPSGSSDNNLVNTTIEIRVYN